MAVGRSKKDMTVIDSDQRAPVRVEPTQEQKDKMTVVVWEIIDTGYYAPAMRQSPMVWTRELRTMAVDEGGIIYVNPDFFDKLSHEEAKGVLLHELHHTMLCFWNRMRSWPGAKDQIFRFNIAHDLEINDMLRAAGVTLPKGGVFPEQFEFPPSLLAEEYYELLEDNVTTVEMCEAAGGSAIEGEDGMEAVGRIRERLLGESTEEQKEALGSAADPMDEEEAKELLNAMAKAAKEEGLDVDGEGGLVSSDGSTDIGSMPWGMTRAIQKAMEKPKVAWRKLLQKQFSHEVYGRLRQQHEREDWTRSRKSHPAAPGKPFYPAKEFRQPTLDHIHVVVDTSGSMSDGALGVALVQIDQILRTQASASKSAKINVYAVDAAVAAHQQVRALPEVMDLMKGGGGTDMMVGINEALETHRKNPRRDRRAVPNIVVLTDGYTYWDEERPGAANVVVCLVGKDHASAESGPKWATTLECDD